MIFVFAVLWFFKNDLITSIGRILIADTSATISDGDTAALLMGDRTGERAQSAFNFLSRNPRSRLLLAPEEATPLTQAGFYPHAHDVHKKFLLDAGISDDRILISDCYNTSTHDEAVCFREFMRTHLPDAQSIVVITSWYHSGRAVWTFKKAFTGSEIAVKAYLPDLAIAKPDFWWQKEYTFLAVFNEYLKWAYWLVKTT